MTAADSPAHNESQAKPAPNEQASYAPYAQLAKMLVPSSGCIAVYDLDGDVIWCSDGYERPDLRELIDGLKSESSRGDSAQGAVRQTSTGVSAYVSEIANEAKEPLGYVAVELPADRGSSMAASLLRPVLECLASRIGLERSMPAATTATVATTDLEFLIGVHEVDPSAPDPLKSLLRQCVDNFSCESAAFLVPDQNITVAVHTHAEVDDARQTFLQQTQKHLLAWAQLNNRPMVVNRVDDRPDTQPYKILSCPVRDSQQRVTGLMALFRAADEANFELRDVRILEFLARKAMGIVNERHDRLTGLMNRVAFEQQLAATLEAEPEGRGTLLYFDIDRLQAVNDAFGLLAGDEVIRRLAELVHGTTSAKDLACRLAGDRFAVFLDGHEESEAERIGRELCDAMARLGYVQGGKSIPVFVSCGMAVQESGMTDGRHLLALAELACKQARSEGGNRLSVYVASETVSPRRERELIAAANLQTALQANEFRLLAQPIYSLADGSEQLAGFEVLVRMRDATGSLVSPDRFMDAARRYGLAPAVDKWVFAALLKDLKEHVALAQDLPLGIGINVAEQSLTSRDYRQFVLDELKQAGLPASSICFELSEAAAVRNGAHAGSFIAEAREAGCLTALDNFGSGLSSLTHLRSLSVDVLKLDGELIRNMLADPLCEALTLGLTKAVQNLRLKAVAQHVESAELSDKVRSIGVDFAQGYAYGQPEPLRRALGRGGGTPLRGQS